VPRNSGTILRASLKNRILQLALENPSGYPRLDRSILLHLLEEFRHAASSTSITGIIITGTEKAFAVGAEIGELAALTPLAARAFSLLGQTVMTQIERSPKPVVAAICGYCFGGGLDLSLACHLRIATEDAQFAHPGASLGILTGWGGTQRLPRTLLPGARSRALELLATGRTISTQEAYALGLISEIVPRQEILKRAIAVTEKSRKADHTQGTSSRSANEA
jgi:enoyl-CoA hydratase